MEVIKARQAGLEMAAPSFKMQYGEARVLKSEAATADAVFESIGASFGLMSPPTARILTTLARSMWTHRCRK